jgi:ABC-type uncharacterized transport system permease subunit
MTARASAWACCWRWLGAGLLWVFLFRTRAGFAQQVGGLAPAAARYAGFSSRKALWVALLVSGGAAGLAGALEVAGPIGQLTPYVPAGYGFAAIIVAFVGRLHPAGMVLVGHSDEHVLHRRRTRAVALGPAQVHHRRVPGLAAVLPVGV